jgi:hypothetical protein
MSRTKMLSALAAALLIGACSDTNSPTGPAEQPVAGEELTLVLDETADMVAVDEEGGAVRQGGARPATAGKGKAVADPQVVSCVRNAWHRLCTDIRNGVLKAARADAIVRNFKNRTNAQIRLNGVILARSGKFGPNFPGDELFANYTVNALNYRVFRGDRICHQFPGVTPQICGTVR